MESEELELILQAVGGNADSFGKLADRYTPTLMGLIYTFVGSTETARDLTQEALLKAYTALGTLHRPERFGSWLRQIAANLAKSHLRQQARRETVPLEEHLQQAAAEPVDRALLAEELLGSLRALPEGPRAALVMHYLVGVPPAEAASRLGISRAAFDTRLSRGRDALRRELSQMMAEAFDQTQQQVAVYVSGMASRVRAALGQTRRERVAAARELALLAARANLARLTRDLTAPDENTRQKAAQLLGDTADRRAEVPLLTALQVPEEEPAVLAELCRSLARIGAVGAIPALRQLARQTAAVDVNKAATEAARSLEAPADAPAGAPATNGDIPVNIGDLKAAGIEALFLELLADPSPSVQLHAIDGLGRVESLKAVPRLAAVLEGAGPGHLRRAAAEALAAILGRGRSTDGRITPAVRTRAVTELAEALGDADRAIQAEAAWSLAQFALDKDAKLRSLVIERLFAALEATVTRPGPWWSTFPALFGNVGGEAEMVRLMAIILRPEVGAQYKGPINGAMREMAAPGRTLANPLIISAIRQGIPAVKLMQALGKSQDPAVVPFLEEYLGPAMAITLQPFPGCNPGPLIARSRQMAAQALAGYPGGAAMLRGAIDAWLAQSAPDQAAVLAAVGALEAAGSSHDVQYLDEIATAAALTPRTQITLRATAKRLNVRLRANVV